MIGVFKTILEMNPPNNPGYISSSQNLLATGVYGPPVSYILYSSQIRGLWLFNINFNTHPLVAQQLLTATSVDYVFVTPSTNLVVTTFSLYNNVVGFYLMGGTSGTTYVITSSVTLSNSDHCSISMNITIR